MSRTTVLVCRDCCCGTARKHPDTDHDAQLHELQQAVSAHDRVVVTRCLGVCERSNVIVVRRRACPAVWFGGITRPDQTAALAGWLHEGGPIPSSLQELRFERPGRAVPVTIR